jgi:hypothetical protein
MFMASLPGGKPLRREPYSGSCQARSCARVILRSCWVPRLGPMPWAGLLSRERFTTRRRPGQTMGKARGEAWQEGRKAEGKRQKIDSGVSNAKAA